MTKVLTLADGWYLVDRAEMKNGKPKEMQARPLRRSVKETVFFTPKQLAIKFHVSHATILEYIRKGMLDAQPMPQGYLISAEAVDHFLATLRERKKA